MKKDESILKGSTSQELVRYEVLGIDRMGAYTRLLTNAYNEEEAIQRMKDRASDKIFVDIVCKKY